MRESSVALKAEGIIVLDGITGKYVDWRVTLDTSAYGTSHGGQTSGRSGLIVECASLPTQTVTSADIPSNLTLRVLGPKIDSTRAKDVARMHLSRYLGAQYRFPRTTKIVRPRTKDVDILDVRSVKIPFLKAVYQLKNRKYVRTMIAATGKFILDEMSSCAVTKCSNQPVIACENCGGLVCESHTKNCTTCGKTYCYACITTKGLLSKKYYCPRHQQKTNL